MTQRQTRERTVLVFRFVLVVGFAFVVAWMLSRAWRPGTASWTVIVSIAMLFRMGPIVGHPLEMFASAVLGFYGGILLLFTFDWRKRIQGLLLAIGSVVGLGVLWRFETLLFNIEPELVNGGWAVFGVIIAGAIGYRDLSSQRNLALDSVKFDTAIGLVFAMLSALALGGLIQALLAGVAIVPLDVPVTVAFVYLLFGFVTYDSRYTVAFLGPVQSGKTVAMWGLYRTFNQRDTQEVIATDDLRGVAAKMDNITDGQPFPTTKTTYADNLGFSHPIGELFPRRVEYNSPDHEGEWYRDIADSLEAISGPLARSIEWLRYLRLWLQVRLLSGEFDTDEERGLRDLKRWTIHRVARAGTALILIDIARFREGNAQLDTLDKMVTELDRRRTDVVLVASKSDYFVHDHLDSSHIDGSDPEAVEHILHPEDRRARSDLVANGRGLRTETEASLAESITEYLTDRSDLIQGALNISDEDYIFPIYVATRYSDEHNAYIPDLGDNENIQLVGYEFLADRLEREAGQRVSI